MQEQRIPEKRGLSFEVEAGEQFEVEVEPTFDAEVGPGNVEE